MNTHEGLVAYASSKGIKFYSSVMEVMEIGGSFQEARTPGMPKRYLTETNELLISDTSAAFVIDAVKCKSYLEGKSGSGTTPIKFAVTTPEVLSRLNGTESTVSRSNLPEKMISEIDVSSSPNRAKVLDTLRDALKRRVSDLHFLADKEKNEVYVWHRLDGELQSVDAREYSLDYDTFIGMCGVVLNYLAVNGGDRTGPFDPNAINGATFTPEGLDCRVRYHHMPSTEPRGLSVSMRITGISSGKVATFDQLGYSPTEINHIRPNFNNSHGLVLFTGPTGAGKTSMMAAGIITIPATRRVLMLEDPVEIPIPNATQFSATKELGFDELSKSLLRKDPDVVAVGEIRDYETLDNAIKNASTGHLVLSTLHTNGTVQTISRMFDMGGTPQRLSTPSLIRAIFANRLIPAVCQECSVSFLQAALNTTLRETESFRSAWRYFSAIHVKPESNNGKRNLNSIRIASRNSGCKKCRGSGYIGRLPVVEILIIDDQGRKFIQASDLVGYETYLKSKGWKSLAERAIELIYEGRVSPVGLDTYIDGIFGNSDSYDYEAQISDSAGDIDAWLTNFVTDRNPTKNLLIGEKVSA